MAQRNTKKLSVRKGTLLTAFAAAAAVTGAGLGIMGIHALTEPGPPEPQSSIQTIHAFDGDLTLDKWGNNDFYGRWNLVTEEQKTLMDEPETESAFDTYLAAFDDLRDRPLLEQAAIVNFSVNSLLTYTNADAKVCTADGCANDDWQPPAESLQLRTGDCEDYALLKYQVLLHLGVPTDRLYFSAVDASGKGPDHAVLLVDVSGKVDDFVVLDIDPYSRLVDSADSTYLPYAVMNDTGYWKPDDKTLKTVLDQLDRAQESGTQGAVAARASASSAPYSAKIAAISPRSPA